MRIGIAVTLLLFAAPAGLAVPTEPLADQLAHEDPTKLVQDVQAMGDPARGAIVFYQPQLTCTRCHAPAGGAQNPLGPDLTKLGEQTTVEHLIDALLDPSKELRKGYETVTIATLDGKTLSGLLAEETPEQIVLRDLAQDGKLLTIAREQIDAKTLGGPSLMPAGLVNTLASRQQFLDLVRYLSEIAAKGPERAQALRPDPALIAPAVAPYESTIDHAGLIRSLNSESLKRGQATYERVCANCHGTHEKPGSLPTAPRFGTTALKNGSDPYSLYRTLTYGYAQMAPQTWMVPRQKYEVIQYLREAYLKNSKTPLASIDDTYLAALPKGSSFGPEPSAIEPWSAMDYGPFLMATYEVGHDGTNLAYKGIAVRLDAGPGGVSRGRSWVVYDHDTMRMAGAWTGQGFIDWNCIEMNGKHEVHSHVVGKVHVANGAGPGWANPADGSFEEVRQLGRDGRAYGPLPRAWAKYKGLYQHGSRVILAYRVREADVLEMPGLETDPAHPDTAIFTRTLRLGPAPHEVVLRVAPEDKAVALAGEPDAKLVTEHGQRLLRLAARSKPVTLKLLMSSGDAEALEAYAKHSPPPVDLTTMTKGGPTRWPEVLTTQGTLGKDDGPFAVDVITHPANNPWLSQMRFTGFDFFPGGSRAIVCDWDGDVWRVDGVDDPGGTLTWKRIGSGLFQPLGVKVVAGAVYIACRDQIVILRDYNNDGETDFYECFNDDHQVTDHFHEFAMDLQTDAAGDFYYTKAARHALPAVVPQHGTLLRVSKDGQRTDILATGFRAPNGVCLNDDGTFFITDQEGHWTPKNRVNWVKPGGFYGNMMGYHSVTDPSDVAMEQPICWITNAVDRSPAQVLHVTSDAWKELKGSLIDLSYGYGKLYVIPHETVGNVMQGGVSPLPVPPIPTGLIRGQFHPASGQLYACGLVAWASSQTAPGGFYRVRRTDKPLHVPVELHVRPRALAITFTGALDPAAAGDAKNYSVKVWSLRRTQNYGSEHHGEHPLEVAGARLEGDRTLVLDLPELAPTMSMEVKYRLKSAQGAPVEGLIHNTIHVVPKED